VTVDDKEQARAYAASHAPWIERDSVGGGGVAVADYARRWLDDREGRVHSLSDDRSRMRDHILPTLGLLDARTFTLSVTRSLARTVAIKSTKSGETRRFAIEPALLPLLQDDE
jgi:hypothetical protein